MEGVEDTRVDNTIMLDMTDPDNAGHGDNASVTGVSWSDVDGVTSVSWSDVDGVSGVSRSDIDDVSRSDVDDVNGVSRSDVDDVSDVSWSDVDNVSGVSWSDIDRHYRAWVPLLQQPVGDIMRVNSSHIIRQIRRTSGRQCFLTGSTAEDLMVGNRLQDLDLMIVVNRPSGAVLRDKSKLFRSAEFYIENVENKAGYVYVMYPETTRAPPSGKASGQASGQTSRQTSGQTSRQTRNVRFSTEWIQKIQKQVKNEILESQFSIENRRNSPAVKSTFLTYNDWHYASMPPGGQIINIWDLGWSFSFEEDTILCLEFGGWPDIASSWRHRQRLWPGRRLVETVARSGYHVVSKSSPNGDTNSEWRLSFSRSEGILCRNMTRKQKVCFKLFKMIYYEALAQNGALKSYHIKTVFLWTLEFTPALRWRTQCLAKSVLQLLDALLIFLDAARLPNYFVPEQNLWEEIPANQIKYIRDSVWNVRENPTNIPVSQLVDFVISGCGIGSPQPRLNLPLISGAQEESSNKLAFCFLQRLILCLTTGSMQKLNTALCKNDLDLNIVTKVNFLLSLLMPGFALYKFKFKNDARNMKDIEKRRDMLQSLMRVSADIMRVKEEHLRSSPTQQDSDTLRDILFLLNTAII